MTRSAPWFAWIILAVCVNIAARRLFWPGPLPSGPTAGAFSGGSLLVAALLIRLAQRQTKQAQQQPTPTADPIPSQAKPLRPVPLKEPIQRRPENINSPAQLVSISEGADFEIDLSAFPEAEPVFAYVDDVGTRAEVLSGLVAAGRLTIPDQPSFLWLDGPRDCVLLKTTAEGRRDQHALFRSLGVGEFCLEIYHVRPKGGVALIHRDDFCFK